MSMESGKFNEIAKEGLEQLNLTNGGRASEKQAALENSQTHYEREAKFWGELSNFLDTTGPHQQQLIQYRSLLTEIENISDKELIDNDQKNQEKTLKDHAQKIIGIFGLEYVTEKIEDYIKFLEHELNVTPVGKESNELQENTETEKGSKTKDDSWKWN